MRNFFLSCVIFAVTSGLTVLFNSPLLPARFLSATIALLILLVIILLCSFQIAKLKPLVKKAQWVLLSIVSLLINLIILSTGSFYSPFLILLPLLALAISLLLTFPISFAFIGFSLLPLIVNSITDPLLFVRLQTDPMNAVITLLSLFIVLPLYQVVSTKYHSKDKAISHLTAEMSMEESILEEVHELVIVTDTSFRILSVNEAVEKYLHHSSSELVDQQLLNMVFLKDTSGLLLTKDKLTLVQEANPKAPRILSNMRLITTPLFAESVQVYIKPIADFEGQIIQILFIISDSHKSTQKDHSFADTFLHARIKYEAKIAAFKKELRQKGNLAFLYQFILIANCQQDLLTTQELAEHPIAERKARVDLAKLCKQTLIAEQDLAKAFHVRLHFSLPDFGEKDIAPLVTNNMPIKPEEFTGPFFTATCDIEYTRLVIQKLLDVATLIASTVTEPMVELSVIRNTPTSFTISITAPSPEITQGEEQAVFTKFYGLLGTKTNVNAGSGLEGFLSKTISDQLGIPLQIKYTKTPSTIAFILQLQR